MLIDWFTVLAQLINFLILAWLLKRFLYKPVLQAMDKREKRITARLQEAETQKAEAQKERGHFQQLSSELGQQREALLLQAMAEANAERQRLMEEARESHRLLRARLRETLDNEQANLSRDIIRRFQEEVFEIAGKVLADLAGSSLEEQMATVLVRRLEKLNDEEREQLSAAFRASNQAITVRSAFGLPAEQQQAIERAVKKIAAPDRQVRFETASAQANGIELITNGYKMAWSIADYLSGLEKDIATILENELMPESKNHDHGA